MNELPLLPPGWQIRMFTHERVTCAYAYSKDYIGTATTSLEQAAADAWMHSGMERPVDEDLENEEFDEYLDETWGTVSIVGSEDWSSVWLKTADPDKYREMLKEWRLKDSAH